MTSRRFAASISEANPMACLKLLSKSFLDKYPIASEKAIALPFGVLSIFLQPFGQSDRKNAHKFFNKLSSKSVRFLFLSFPVRAGTSGIRPIVYSIYCSLYSLSPVLSTESRKNPPPAAAAPFSSEIYLLPAVEKRTLFTRPFPVARFIPVYSFTLNSSICGQQIFSSSGPAGAT